MALSGCVSEDVPPQPSGLSLSSSAVFPLSQTVFLQSRQEANKVELGLAAGKILRARHVLEYKCCTNVSIASNFSRESGSTVITVLERDSGKSDESGVGALAPDCNAACGYSVVAFFEPVDKGAFLLRVMGVEKAGVGPKVLAEESFEVAGGELVLKSEVGGSMQKGACKQDSDCVKSTCCHSSSCVNERFAPDCSDVYCTQECRPGTFDCGGGFCKCDQGTCLAVLSK
ncbi:MAG: hypothetical protein WC792_02415 [Candidatus Micrarchaeia archaeon]